VSGDTTAFDVHNLMEVFLNISVRSFV
jgi:hypothetical protein